MKKAYARPELIEYGPMSQLTLGSGGEKPDIPPFPTIACSDTGTSTTACLTVQPSPGVIA
jgi:hypothetical protein